MPGLPSPKGFKPPKKKNGPKKGGKGHKDLGDSRTDPPPGWHDYGPPTVVGQATTGTNDPNLVGSGNDIENFDGTVERFPNGNVLDTGVGSESGGGGGTGSSTAGRESVGLVGQTEGQSLEEVVYGVQKRKGTKTGRARGE